MVVMLIGILFAFIEGMALLCVLVTIWELLGMHRECQGSCLLRYPSWKQVYM